MTLFIEPGGPWENGYREIFNSKLRDELLNGEISPRCTKLLKEAKRNQANDHLKASLTPGTPMSSPSHAAVHDRSGIAVTRRTRRAFLGQARERGADLRALSLEGRRAARYLRPSKSAAPRSLHCLDRRDHVAACRVYQCRCLLDNAACRMVIAWAERLAARQTAMIERSRPNWSNVWPAPKPTLSRPTRAGQQGRAWFAGRYG